MDNQFNKLITKEQVENILNSFGNIGNNGEYLKINDVEKYQLAFVHESYYMSCVKNILHKNNAGSLNNIYLNYIPKHSNERLEYLGDHILKSIMGKYIYRRFGEEREGFLTKLKIKIEKCSSLHKIALTLGFKEFLLLSLQVENETILDIDRGRGTHSYFEDAFEAFIGSIVQDFEEPEDMGYIYAERFVINVIENIIDFSELISINDNFKDSLQRFFQSNETNSKKWKNPQYILLHELTELYNQKVFVKCVLLTETQLNQLSLLQINNIKNYTTNIVQHYKHKNPILFEKIMNLLTENENTFHQTELEKLLNLSFEQNIISLQQLNKIKTLENKSDNYNENSNEIKYILGIAQGKKIILAEQEVAKQCLLNLDLDLDYY